MVFSVDYKPQPGGIAEHAHKVAIHLHRAGTPVCVLAPRRDGWRAFDRAQPFATYRVPAIPGLDLVLYFLSGLFLIRRHRVDIVYCATSHPCALISRMLRWAIRLRFTVTVHAHEVVYSGRSRRAALKRMLRPLQIGVLRSADRVFAVSSFTRDALVKNGVPQAQTALLMNGVDARELDEAPKDTSILDILGIEGRPIILTVARLDIHKGHDVVIKALPSILAGVPDAVYVIVGDGPMRRSLEELSRSCGVSDHVVFVGYVSRAQTLALFAACRVFVMMSRIQNGSTEGFGIVFLEAGVFSKPVVGGRSGGVPDAIVDGETGFLVDPLDEAGVAASVLKLLTNPGLAARMGVAGSRRAREHFTWEATVKTLFAELGMEPGKQAP
jgi:phosphatidylinositol alpha-1,6-mannosyltransferase